MRTSTKRKVFFSKRTLHHKDTKTTKRRPVFGICGTVDRSECGRQTSGTDPEVRRSRRPHDCCVALSFSRRHGSRAGAATSPSTTTSGDPCEEGGRRHSVSADHRRRGNDEWRREDCSSRHGCHGGGFSRLARDRLLHQAARSGPVSCRGRAQMIVLWTTPALCSLWLCGESSS